MSLPERPRIPERFSWFQVDSGEFRIHSLTYSLAVKIGEPDLLAGLLPLLDGRRSLDDVVAALGAFGRDAVTEVLEYLSKVGLLEDAAAPFDGTLSDAERERYSEQLTFFSHFTAGGAGKSNAEWPGIPQSAEVYQQRLRDANVAVLGLGRLGSALVRSLALAGIGTITLADDGSTVTERDAYADPWFTQSAGARRAHVIRDRVAALNPHVTVRTPRRETAADLDAVLGGATFAVLANDRMDPGEYEAVDRACLAARIRWTSCRLQGFELQIGPTVIPYSTPCFACFSRRIQSNVPDFAEYELVESFLRTGTLRDEMLAFTPGVELAALEVVKAVTELASPATYAKLFVLNLLTMTTTLHPVLKIPRCPHCGPAARGYPTVRAWGAPSNRSDDAATAPVSGR